MMKLILSLTLIWALSNTARALTCLSCSDPDDPQCSTTTTVPCSTMCITASIQATSGQTQAQQIYKACAPSNLCPSTGPHTYSVNIFVSSAVANAECCDSDDCNSEVLSFPATPTANSLMCNTCLLGTSQCDVSIQCRGDEDRCFQATATSGSNSAPTLGCASDNMCAATGAIGSLPFTQNVGTISDQSCCATSLCNTVPTTAAPTTTTAAPTTTTAAPTTTTAAPTTTTAATTATAAVTTTNAVLTTTTTTASSDACSLKLVMINLLLGLFILILC